MTYEILEKKGRTEIMKVILAKIKDKKVKPEIIDLCKDIENIDYMKIERYYSKLELCDVEVNEISISNKILSVIITDNSRTKYIGSIDGLHAIKKEYIKTSPEGTSQEFFLVKPNKKDRLRINDRQKYDMLLEYVLKEI